MHLQRWITGLVLLPFLIYPVIKGGIAFFCLVAIAAVLSVWEYFRIVFSKSNHTITHPAAVLGLILTPIVIFLSHLGASQVVMGLLSLNLLATALIATLRFKGDREEIDVLFKQLVGWVYIVLPLSMLTFMRGEAQGAVWIFLVLIIVFIGDTSAYHVGVFFGRHKLCPSVSPGKTIEGSIGGLAANLIAGSIYKALLLPGLPWMECLLFFIVAGIAGQIGDLFESQLKRLGDIKDSGSIFPGHGGILDRIDALLFAAPVAFLFRMYIV